MRTELCDRLGIEFPIFAFTHCRDVVAAVSQAGGLGVLGVVGFSPEQIETELRWIDDHIGDHPYGVDLVIPSKYEGMDLGNIDPEVLEKQLQDMIPKEHRDFAAKLLEAVAGVNAPARCLAQLEATGAAVPYKATRRAPSGPAGADEKGEEGNGNPETPEAGATRRDREGVPRRPMDQDG